MTVFSLDQERWPITLDQHLRTLKHSKLMAFHIYFHETDAGKPEGIKSAHRNVDLNGVVAGTERVRGLNRSQARRTDAIGEGYPKLGFAVGARKSDCSDVSARHAFPDTFSAHGVRLESHAADGETG